MRVAYAQGVIISIMLHLNSSVTEARSPCKVTELWLHAVLASVAMHLLAAEEMQMGKKCEGRLKEAPFT